MEGIQCDGVFSMVLGSGATVVVFYDVLCRGNEIVRELVARLELLNW